MPITVQHSKTATTPDITSGSNSGEIRPSHWNESHVVSISLATNEVIKYIGAGGASQSSGNLSFADSHGLSFGLAGGVITGSHNGLTSQSVQTQGIQSISAGGNSVGGGQVVFSNANSVSFGLAGSTVTASISTLPQTVQSLGIYGSSQTTGASSSSTVDARSLSIVGAGGVSVGLTNGSLVISGATGGGGGDGYNILAAGTQTANLSTTVQFANSNSITFGMSGNAQITASFSQFNQAVSAPNGSSSFQTLSFANSFGVSWSLSNGSVVASVAAGGGANSLSQYAVGNTAGDSSSNTQPLSSFQVRGAGIASVGYSGDGALIISVPAGGGGGDGANFIAAGTQTATTLGTVAFVNSNGISFGMSGSTQVTASHNGLTTAALSNHSHGNPTLALTNLTGTTASASNGLTLSLSAASQSVQTVGLYGSSQTTGQSSSSSVDARSISIVGAGNISVGLSAGSFIVSGAAGGQTNQTIGVYASSQTTGQSSSNTVDARSFTHRGMGIVSVGMSGNELLISATQSNQAFSAPGGSSSFQTLTFANSFGVSWSNSGGSVMASVAAQTAQTIGLYGSSNTTGQSSSSTVDARSLSFRGAGIISVGLSAGEMIISASAAGAGDGVNIIAAGTQTATTNGTVVFSNSNNVSFGMSGSTRVTASFSQSAQSVGVYGISNTTGASSSSTYDARSLSFVGVGIISVGQSNGSIQISAPDAVDFTQLSVGFSTQGNTAGNTGLVTGQLNLVGSNNITLSGSTNAGSITVSIIGGAGGGGVGLSAGTQSVSTGTVVLSNSNNITFGMSGSSRVTASYAFNVSGGTTSNNLNALTFSNSNGVSFGLNGSTLTGSVATSLTNINVSAGTTSNNLSAVVFSNANGVSFGLNGSTVTGSVVPGAATLSVFAVGNTTQSSSGTVPSGNVSFNGLGAISMGVSNGSIQVSAPATSSLSATGAVSLSTNGSTISVGVPQLSLYAVAGATTAQSSSSTFSLGSLTFQGAGGIYVGFSNSAVVISQGAMGIVASSQTTAQSSSSNADARSLTFIGAGNVSVGLSGAGGAIVISGGGGGAAVTASAANGSYTVGNLSFSNANGVSWSTSAGSAIVASVAAQTNQTGGIYITAQTTGQSSSSTYDLRTLSILGDGIVSIGWSNSTLRVSATQSNQAASASNGSFAFQTLGFSNANGVTFGTSAGSIVTASVAGASAGVAAFRNSQTTYTSGTIAFLEGGGALTIASNAGQQFLLSVPATSSLSATGILSISSNGSTISIGVPGNTKSFWGPFDDAQTTLSQVGNGSMFVQPMLAIDAHMSLSRVDVMASLAISSSSNSSHAGAISLYAGIFTRNGSTLSLASSGSTVHQFSNTSNNSQSSIEGVRRLSIPINANLVHGNDFWIGIISRTSTTNANWFTATNVRVSMATGQITGLIGEVSNITKQLSPGYGLWSTTSTNLPASLAFSDIRGIGSGVANNALPLFMNGNNFTA